MHHPPQQSAAHQAPQQMFPTQMPYGSYPYMNMNMYSPVTGVRAEDQYAALYAASMPFGMGVDLSAILPPTTPMSQAGANQQHPGSTQHRSDTHNLVDMNKFASGNTRDGSGQQPSNVAPPPGFANPSFMPQPGLSSLFLQQQFPPHPYSFMMPNVGSGRQMYPQEDDRKSYDKMGGAKQAQATPPQHYHNVVGREASVQEMSAPVALVTGATSSVGKAIVRRLAFAGHKVAAADQCPNAVNDVAEDNKRVGGNVLGFSFNIEDKAHRSELLSRVVQEMGALDSVVIVPPDNDVRGDIIDTDIKHFDKLFNDRLTIPFRLTQAALPLLEKSTVMYITSCAGFTPGLDIGLLSVAATAVLGLTKNVALSAARRGVRVNSVCFGMVENDGTGAFWDTHKSEEALQELQSMIPLGRLGRPSDAASLVQFLISSRARYITGENCLLNGGVSFRL
ncbi:oxidoreductase, short chain dehydrogenase/reductase family protein [Ostertagia ostertagi]